MLALPWSVRYVRWWSAREARRHRICADAGCRYATWHRQQAADAERVAATRREHFLTSGARPSTVVDARTALARMRGELRYPEAPHAHAGDLAADQPINARIDRALRGYPTLHRPRGGGRVRPA
jgi:hypothetical protein